MRTLVSCFLMGFLLSTGSMAAISFGHIDDFNDGTTRSWGQPGGNPANIADSGPSGAPGDHSIRYQSTGTSGSFSKVTLFQRNPNWQGDYIAAGVTAISGDFKNDGNEDLELRFAVSNIGGNADTDPSITWFSTIVSHTLPANGTWTRLNFNIEPASFVKVSSGVSTIQDILTDMFELRLIANDQPDYRGETLATTLSVDNVQAVPEARTGMLLFIGLAGLFRFLRGSRTSR